ncbi:hypothetical protein FRB99_002426 [Tulasnella sp. 403]|nr:hypothetical protein FRB99_002426 [Tulasnella sp. 403]
MLTRHDTIIFDTTAFGAYQKVTGGCHSARHGPSSPIRTPSPGQSSTNSSASGIDVEEEEETLEPVPHLPNLFLSTSQAHYEFWDPRPQDFLSLGGYLFVSSDQIPSQNGTPLDFSHFELEIKTHGRQGRFSRENIWSPSYIDYASTPIPEPAALHLSRTRVKSFISFASRKDSFASGSVRMAFKVGLPQELFRIMRTRHLRLSARAIFLGWKGGVVTSTEVVEADPATISVSVLRMHEYTISN